MSEYQTKSGMVSIVGRPNTGKSTLLNKIVGEKIAIVSKVPQTTRRQIRGIYSDERGQIVFIDTPGFHKQKDNLDKYMNNSSTSTIDEVDCLIYLVDTTRRIGEEEHLMIEKVKRAKVPVIFGLNKVETKLGQPDVYIEFLEEAYGKPVTEIENVTLIALSGKTGINIDQLINVLYDHLPHGPMLYPVDIISDMPQKQVFADTIREKLFLTLRDELPHAVGVFIEHTQPRKGNTLQIKALIYVEKNTQKEIVIGKNGSNLKKVGTLAREDLEDLLEQQVFLELFVKVNARWRDDVTTLHELGYE